MKGLKRMLLGFPKLRGFHSYYEKAVTIPLARLATFSDGATVTLEALKDAGLVRRASQFAKIVGNGSFAKKLTIKGIAVSEGAKKAIESAGGKVA